MIKVSLFLSLLMTMSNFTSTGVAIQTPAMHGGTAMTQEEMRFVDLTNKERAARGLQQLTVDPLLIEVARSHSAEMGEKHYFSHHSPTPSLETPMDRYLAALHHRPSWALVGENLFYCSIVDVKRGHEALMNSPSHKENILEPRYDRIGVGTYIAPDGEFYVTEMFLSKTDD